MSKREPDEEIRIWQLPAIAPGAAWEECFSGLTEEERARALRIRAGVARDEFVTGRAALRKVLGVALGVAPGTVEILTGPQGKPRVEGIWFNVAHSSGLILLALCRGGEIGVDVERVQREVNIREIVETHFTADERARVLSAKDPVADFYEVWTRKEAALKAAGVGLSVSLDSVDVSAGECAEIGNETVYLQRLELGPGWCGCVGSLGRPRAVVLIDSGFARLELQGI